MPTVLPSPGVYRTRPGVRLQHDEPLDVELAGEARASNATSSTTPRIPSPATAPSRTTSGRRRANPDRQARRCRMEPERGSRQGRRLAALPPFSSTTCTGTRWHRRRSGPRRGRRATVDLVRRPDLLDGRGRTRRSGRRARLALVRHVDEGRPVSRCTRRARLHLEPDAEAEAPGARRATGRAGD